MVPGRFPKGKFTPTKTNLTLRRGRSSRKRDSHPRAYSQDDTHSTKRRKIAYAWAFQRDGDPGNLISNTRNRDWRWASGRYQKFPEYERAVFFEVTAARQKINTAQTAIIQVCEQNMMGQQS
jgi:predicted NUDIX family NTP pyrophosphohydrolase